MLGDYNSDFELSRSSDEDLCPKFLELISDLAWIEISDGVRCHKIEGSIHNPVIIDIHKPYRTLMVMNAVSI